MQAVGNREKKDFFSYFISKIPNFSYMRFFQNVLPEHSFKWHTGKQGPRTLEDSRGPRTLEDPGLRRTQDPRGPRTLEDQGP